MNWRTANKRRRNPRRRGRLALRKALRQLYRTFGNPNFESENARAEIVGSLYEYQG